VHYLHVRQPVARLQNGNYRRGGSSRTGAASGMFIREGNNRGPAADAGVYVTRHDGFQLMMASSCQALSMVLALADVKHLANKEYEVYMILN
jgi:hypothetical protein